MAHLDAGRRVNARQLEELKEYLGDLLARELVRVVRAAVRHGAGMSYEMADCVEMSGFSRAHLYREIAAGRLVVVRPGGGEKIRVLPEHFRQWLLGQRALGTPPAVGVSLTRKIRARKTKGAAKRKTST